MSDKTGLTIDEALEHVGSCGFYQIRLVLLLGYLQGVVITFQVALTAIVAAEPPWQCAVNSSVCNTTGLFRPGDQFYDKRCSMQRSDWEFSEEFTSIISEFNLVCESTFLGSLSAAAIFFGWLVGALVGGILADKFGRKITMIPFSFAACVFGLLSAFPSVLWLNALLRFIVGFNIGCSLMPIFVLIVEYVGIRHRHIAGISIWFAGEAGSLVFIGLAFAIRDWRHLTITAGACGLLCIFFWWFVPESARYLQLKGRFSEAEHVLRRISITNKKPYPKEGLTNYSNDNQEQKMGSYVDLFRTWRMARVTCVSCFSWFVNAMVYYGVVFSSPSLGTDIYLSFTLTTIVNIPAHFLCIYCMGRFGRKKSVVWGLISASVFAMATVLLTMNDMGADKGFLAGRVIMAMLAKFAINISFDGIYVYSAELFPTVVRNIGLDTCSALGRIGSIAAPFIITLNRVHDLLPYAIMAGASLVAGVLCLTLPETKGSPTAEVMDDTTARDEVEGASRKTFSFS